MGQSLVIRGAHSDRPRPLLWMIAWSLLFVAPAGRAIDEVPLTLAGAEQLALSDDPAIAAMRARARALDERAVADGQLPDPKLKFGLFNVPLNNLDLEEHPTTQFRVGVQQALPRGDTLRLQQSQGAARAEVEQARSAQAEVKVLRDVREHYLEVWYQAQAARIVEQSRSVFADLVDITESHYAAGRVSQQDVLRASLEFDRLDDRVTRIRNAEETHRAALARWIGAAAVQPWPDAFPELAEPLSRDGLAQRLQKHPVITVETARIEVANHGVRISKEQYKPGWSVGLEYRKRFGDDPDGSDRDDMMAVMATVDLPLFTEKRQDRRMAASQHEADAATLTRDDRMRELREMLDREYSNWLRLGERKDLYDNRLLRDAGSNAEASLSAYQAGVTEFTSLMRARLTELDVRLDSLRIDIDRAKAQARLLYLQGEVQ